MRNALTLWRAATLMSVCVALLLPMPSTYASAAPASTFLFGTNMPWLNWANDFGGGRNGGVSANITEVDAKLQAAHAAGMRIIRWWVFEGNSPHIQRDGSGTPTGLDPNVMRDMDAALAEADKFDMYYNFVLFGSTNDDGTTHQWWENAAKRQALVQVLSPLFQRYASNPRVHTWEIVNEPEWQSRNGQTSVSGMLATGDAIANAVHQNSSAQVTVGNAQIQDMQTWAGHPIDYYSPHYYDNFGTGPNDPFVNPANSPDGKPVVIGEFPASRGLNPDSPTRWQKLYANGYAGGWNWSFSPEHTSDHLATDIAAASGFANGKPNVGPTSDGPPASAPSPAAGGPTFVLGFATLSSALGDVMGSPVENEHGIQSGCDTQQLTTTGLAYWRCATNAMTFAAFPDGMHHWALINGQVLEWFGPSPDPT
jgi:hypothetical protein